MSEEERREAIEAARRLRTSTKGQITACANRLKVILETVPAEGIRSLINNLETENLYQKLQSLSTSFEAAYENYIVTREAKENDA